MPGDRKQFWRAQSKWELLKKDGCFGAPVGDGRTAIVTSAFTDEEPHTTTGISELTSFRSEALALADRIHSSGGVPELAIDATHNDITYLIQDPGIVSMYTIGNGSLSTLLLGVKSYYDWGIVSAATTHLKLGTFIQRQCGGLTRNLNVPLGLFAVSDPRKVYAALGDESFYPQNLDDVENDKISAVFAVEFVDYATVKHLG